MQNYQVLSEPDPSDNPSGNQAEATRQSEPSVPAPSGVGEVNFSLDPDGIYLPPQTLVLSCDTPGAVVRYSLDGAEEMTEFDLAQPLVLTQSAVVVAQAFKDEMAGPSREVEYFIRAAVWQNREPEDQSDPTPHELSESAALPNGWHLAAASVRGKLHAHRGLWREDAFAWGQVGEWTICVVSDGAGSAPLSRVGSALVCRTVKESLEVALSEWSITADDAAKLKAADLPVLRGHLVAAAQGALAALQAKAQARERPVNDFAATLLVLVHCPWGKTRVWAALQVGDGLIALYDNPDYSTLLGAADHGEHSSETRFLTTKGVDTEFEQRVSFAVRDVNAAALMTDGVSDDFFPEKQRIGELFGALLPQLEVSTERGATVQEWLGYEKKGSSDDRTLVMLWRAVLEKTKPDLEFDAADF